MCKLYVIYEVYGLRILSIFLVLAVKDVLSIGQNDQLSVLVNPPKPVEGQRVSLKCHINKRIPDYHYMEILDDSNRVILHQFRTDQIKFRSTWKDRKDVKAEFLKWNLTLQVNFTARLSDNGFFTCKVVLEEYPDDQSDWLGRTSLWIQRRPQVLEFLFTQKDSDRPRITFRENDYVKSVCTVSLGYPEAKVVIETHGIVTMQQTLTKKKPDIHRYNETTVIKATRVTHAEDGKVFKCNAENKHGTATRSQKISVLYGVRELYFPYNKNMKFAVGTYLECFAAGNPSPTINITATPINITLNSASKSVSWGRAKLDLPRGKARMEISKQAAIGMYRIHCTAKNRVGERNVVQYKAFNVYIDAPINAKQSSVSIIIVLAVFLAISLLLNIVLCVMNRRKNYDMRRERSRNTELQSANSLLRGTTDRLSDERSLSDEKHSQLEPEQQSTTLKTRPIENPSEYKSDDPNEIHI